MWTPSSTEHQRHRPGRSRHVAVAGGLVAALVFSAAACGDSGDSSKQSAAKSTTTTVVVLSESELTAALLTVADLPPGWAADPSVTTTTTESDSTDATDFLCPTAAEPFKQEQHDSADVAFSQSETGPFLLQSLTSAPDADQHFDDLKGVLRSCVGTPWTTDLDGESMELKMTDVSAARVGDEVAAVRITGTEASAQVTLAIDFVLVRQGTVLELYGGLSAQSPLLQSAPLTASDFATIVATGNRKVVQQLGT
jgi:hypothetical protein